NRTVKWRLLIKCRYFDDEDYTRARLDENEEWITLCEGAHRIRITGFTGYVSFKPGIISFGRIIIHGYTLRIDLDTPG
ncbi:MAG: hypothetical protein ACQXXD_02760, partial [Thermoplasmatota archaeon]